MKRIFGRLISFDERSRRFPVRALIDKKRRRTRHWRCGLVLDQGAEGACVGFSIAHEAAAEPVSVPGVDNALARKIYCRARELDEFEGVDYEGTSVLGGMKAGKDLGLYGAYHWAFGEEDLALAIGHFGPAVLGINWYTGMGEPDQDGLIHVGGWLEGGHAIMANGYDATRKLYRLHNSWGADWGKGGECFITQADMVRLLAEEGEVAIPDIRTIPGKKEKARN
jgi:hypothetical protein